jgi:aminoglycoside phosphotransferase (APT) family kinase protein
MFAVLDSLDSIVAAAARHGLVLHDPTLDTMGLDFLAVHARDADGVRWIVRAPRRADVAAGALVEARVLAAVRGRLPADVPDWRIAAEVIAYPRLPGTPVVTLDGGAPTWNGVDPAAPAPAFLAQLAALIAALQRVPHDGLRTRTIAEERAEATRIVERSVALIDPPAEILARWRRWIADDTLWPDFVALSHGDLHPGHMLLDEHGTLTGILDWTEGRVGDPGIDLAMMLRCFGRPALEAIAGGLERSWPRAVEHAIERAATFPASAADWADRTGNADILAYAKSELAQLR